MASVRSRFSSSSSSSAPPWSCVASGSSASVLAPAADGPASADEPAASAASVVS